MRTFKYTGAISHKILNGAASSQLVRYILDPPARNFGLQVVTTSSSAVLTVFGSIASSSEGGTPVSLMTYSSGTSGAVQSTGSTFAAFGVISVQVTAVATSAGSSGKTISAWLSAAP